MALWPRTRIRRVDAGREQSRTRRRELIAQLSAPLRSFLLTESGSAGLLLGATVLALVAANSAAGRAVRPAVEHRARDPAR